MDYRLEKDDNLLERCRTLAQQLDPQDGAIRLQRLMLRQGVEDRSARTNLVARARQRGTCLCPHCFGHVPLPRPDRPAPLPIEPGGCNAHGYALRYSESGLTSQLSLETPHGILFAGRAPDAWLTRNGALAFIVAPLVLLAALMTLPLLPLPLVMTSAAGVGLIAAALVLVIWPAQPSRQRIHDLAWQQLVPAVLNDAALSQAWLFLGALAEASLDYRASAQRLQALEDCLDAPARCTSARHSLGERWRACGACTFWTSKIRARTPCLPSWTS